MALKNRVPPLIWVLVTGAIMWLVARSPFGHRVDAPYFAEIGTIFIALGVIVIVLGIAQFSKLKTTVNPLDLTESTRLASGGPYRFTRNPMYLGMALVLVGWGFHLGSPVNILCIAAFVIVMTELQIKPEEAALRGLFGEEYEAYCGRVQRWL